MISLKSAKRGLLLVDTKYEFGKDADGNILLIDEVGGGLSKWGTPGEHGWRLHRAAPKACAASSSPAAGLPPPSKDCRRNARTRWRRPHPSPSRPAPRAPPQIHTPDSSRYWLADTYEARHAAGQEPENIDKEFLRLWFRERCDPYKDEVGV
jgi:hypothetical protein